MVISLRCKFYNEYIYIIYIYKSTYIYIFTCKAFYCLSPSSIAPKRAERAEGIAKQWWSKEMRKNSFSIQKKKRFKRIRKRGN